MIVICALLATLLSVGSASNMQFMDPGDNFGNYLNQPPDYTNYFQRMDTLVANYRKVLLGSLVDDERFCEIFKFLQPKPNSAASSESQEADLGSPKGQTEETKINEIQKQFATLLDDVDDEHLNLLVLQGFSERCMDPSSQLMAQKRDNKVIGKPVRFHSWGGKRDKPISRVPRIANPNFNRIPFHSWGGK